MGWLGLLKGLVVLASHLAKYLGDKQLLSAGAAVAVQEGLSDVLAFIDNAEKGAAGITDNGDPEWAERVRNKYKRK